jgi:hypothetical protein
MSMQGSNRTALALCGLALLLSQRALAQAPGGDEALARQLSNPVSSLISVPFQYNADFGYDADDGVQQKLNIQPVIPTALNDRWNLISRVIVPVVYQDDVIPNSSQFGLGDITPSFFFSPREPTASGWTWGVGPVFLLPTATDDLLGTEKWGAGPTLVALKQTEGGLTFGALVNHIWSFAGDDDRDDVSATFLQPFIAKQFPGARTLTFNLESTYDWEHAQWTVPLNVTYSKVLSVGGQRLSLAGGVRGYLDAPDGGPDWGVRLVLTLLYPTH